jgi:hypothetical protein
MRNRAFLLGLALVVAAGCRVNQTEDADGDQGLEVDAVPIEVETDTQSVVVPDVNLGGDTARADTTTTR